MTLDPCASWLASNYFQPIYTYNISPTITNWYQLLNYVTNQFFTIPAGSLPYAFTTQPQAFLKLNSSGIDALGNNWTGVTSTNGVAFLQNTAAQLNTKVLGGGIAGLTVLPAPVPMGTYFSTPSQSQLYDPSSLAVCNAISDAVLLVKIYTNSYQGGSIRNNSCCDIFGNDIINYLENTYLITGSVLFSYLTTTAKNDLVAKNPAYTASTIPLQVILSYLDSLGQGSVFIAQATVYDYTYSAPRNTLVVSKDIVFQWLVSTYFQSSATSAPIAAGYTNWYQLVCAVANNAITSGVGTSAVSNIYATLNLTSGVDALGITWVTGSTNTVAAILNIVKALQTFLNNGSISGITRMPFPNSIPSGIGSFVNFDYAVLIALSPFASFGSHIIVDVFLQSTSGGAIVAGNNGYPYGAGGVSNVYVNTVFNYLYSKSYTALDLIKVLSPVVTSKMLAYYTAFTISTVTLPIIYSYLLYYNLYYNNYCLTTTIDNGSAYNYGQVYLSIIYDPTPTTGSFSVVGSASVLTQAQVVAMFGAKYTGASVQFLSIKTSGYSAPSLASGSVLPCNLFAGYVNDGALGYYPIPQIIYTASTIQTYALSVASGYVLDVNCILALGYLSNTAQTAFMSQLGGNTSTNITISSTSYPLSAGLNAASQHIITWDVVTGWLTLTYSTGANLVTLFGSIVYPLQALVFNKAANNLLGSQTVYASETTNNTNYANISSFALDAVLSSAITTILGSTTNPVATAYRGYGQTIITAPFTNAAGVPLVYGYNFGYFVSLFLSMFSNATSTQSLTTTTATATQWTNAYSALITQQASLAAVTAKNSVFTAQGYTAAIGLATGAALPATLVGGL